VPVEPVERYLAFLTDVDRSPNTVKAYAHDLKDWFVFLTGRGLDWREVRLEDVGEFVAWLRLPPPARDGRVAVLPSVEAHCGSATVNRKLSAVSAFYQHAARHGIDLGELLTSWQPAGRRGTSWRPFLHHISKSQPAARRVIGLKVPRKHPRILTNGEVQTIMDACDRLRDRLLFALLHDTGIFSRVLTLRRSLISRVCAAQKLLVELYRVQQVWCKWLLGCHLLVVEIMVALKRLPPGLTGDPEFEARLRAEAALAARLHNPHVIPIHDFGEIDGQLFIDMRLVEGIDLATLLAERGPLTGPHAVSIVVQVASALDAAHAAHLVHRDIKPSNVLLSRPSGRSDDAPDFVYVADFGIARAVGSAATSLTRTGATVGSLDYMAPELFTDGHGDHRVDVHSLGCLLFEGLTACRPFDVAGLPAIINAHLSTPPPRASALRLGLPSVLDDVIAQAMADPNQVFQSAGALAAAARSALERISHPLQPTTEVTTPPKTVCRDRSG